MCKYSWFYPRETSLFRHYINLHAYIFDTFTLLFSIRHSYQLYRIYHHYLVPDLLIWLYCWCSCGITFILQLTSNKFLLLSLPFSLLPSPECSNFSPPATVILLILLCFEGLLFLIFTAVMFGTQVHSICSDETVSKWNSNFSALSLFCAPCMGLGGCEPLNFPAGWCNALSSLTKDISSLYLWVGNECCIKSV